MKSFKQFINEAAVDKKGLKSSTGGLTQKGRDYFNRKDGSNLKAPVTKKPSELKKVVRHTIDVSHSVLVCQAIQAQ